MSDGDAILSFVSPGAIATLSGACLAVVVVTNTIRKLTGWGSPWVAFFLSLALSLFGALHGGTLTGARADLLPFVTAFVLFSTALGLNETVARGRRKLRQPPGRIRPEAAPPAEWFSSWFHDTEEELRDEPRAVKERAGSVEEELALASARPETPRAYSVPARAVEKWAEVTVFYASDRKSSGDPAPDSVYGSERDQILHYGHCRVAIPAGHMTGELERPSVWRGEDPRKHLVLVGVYEYQGARDAPKNQFFERLGLRILQSERKEALVFIHGYNVDFAEAARRAAQLAYDLNFSSEARGIPIFYSWPSNGTVRDYVADRTAAEATVPLLTGFLKDLASLRGVDRVHVIAHSMGNKALTDALRSPGLAGVRFNQIVLAAPDLDAGVFRRDIAPAMKGAAERTTLYASSNDLVLALSETLNKAPRAGESGDDKVVVVEGMDTVDASEVSSGHSYFADVRPVVTDLALLLHTGLPPAERNLKARTSQAGAVYWTFSP
jgi:esterase/lipase superfamily enzyme